MEPLTVRYCVMYIGDCIRVMRVSNGWTKKSTLNAAHAPACSQQSVVEKAAESVWKTYRGDYIYPNARRHSNNQRLVMKQIILATQQCPNLDNKEVKTLVADIYRHDVPCSRYPTNPSSVTPPSYDISTKLRCLRLGLTRKILNRL